MSRDRLGGYGGSYEGGSGNYGQGNPYARGDNYATDNPYAGYHQGASNPPQAGYNQPSNAGGYEGRGDAYEMQNYNAPQRTQNDMYDEFLSQRQEVSNAIDKLNADVTRLDSLHNRSLNDLPDDPNSQNTTRQIDSLMADTARLRDGIKASIQGLTERARQARGDMQKQMVNQTESVRKKFVESINRFQQVEKAYRDRTRQRMERQMRIVKPDASQQEIQAAIDDNQGGQIFSQALMTSTRYGEARSALREVQNRHQDIQKIERTITELADLFREMSVMIEVQEPIINQIGEQAQQTQDHLNKGIEETQGAIVLARKTRKKKWWCLGIIVLIIIIIVVVVIVVKLATK